MARSISRWASPVLVTICAIIAAPFGMLHWHFDGHGASLCEFTSIRPGMTQHRVRRLLGNPGTINRSSLGSESWFYTRWTWCQAKVYFDKAGIVTETDHDH